VHRAARARELFRAGADARRRGGHRVTEAQVREDRGHPAFERVEARVRALIAKVAAHGVIPSAARASRQPSHSLT
jgi:hypothetical protein